MDEATSTIGQAPVVEQAASLSETAPEQTRTYLHLLRAAANMFRPEEFNRIAPRLRSAPAGSKLASGAADGQAALGHRDQVWSRLSGDLDPIAATESIAYDFLARGGKYSRPFITLAVYDALIGGKSTGADGAAEISRFSDSVRRAAMSIETFHKASLVHDDIEDDDAFRYGEETVHKKYGAATAINVGDYLIGLGYKLVSGERKALGAETVADILDCLADAHLRLSEGQGAELLWRETADRRLKPIDALNIYALKTAPAFEAALFLGARLAGPAEVYAEPIKHFARNLGVAFQILNDLGDWQQDDHNKLVAGGDILSGRPTVLWAIAIEGLPPAKQSELLSLIANNERSAEVRIEHVRQLYQEAGVFEKANRLIEKHRQRAEQIAAAIAPAEFRTLLVYLIDSVLDAHQPASPRSLTGVR